MNGKIRTKKLLEGKDVVANSALTTSLVPAKFGPLRHEDATIVGL